MTRTWKSSAPISAPAAPRRPHQRDPYPLGARAVRRWNPLVRRHRRRTHRVGDHRRGRGFNGHPSALQSRPAFLKPARSDCAATPYGMVLGPVVWHEPDSVMPARQHATTRLRSAYVIDSARASCMHHCMFHPEFEPMAWPITLDKVPDPSYRRNRTEHSSLTPDVFRPVPAADLRAIATHCPGHCSPTFISAS